MTAAIRSHAAARASSLVTVVAAISGVLGELLADRLAGVDGTL